MSAIVWWPFLGVVDADPVKTVVIVVACGVSVEFSCVVVELATAISNYLLLGND